MAYDYFDIRGVCWNTIGNPTIADNRSEQVGSFGGAAFSCPMTGLTAGETYYVRAYAHNSAGYGYGSQVSFTHYTGIIILAPLTSVDSDGSIPIMSLGITPPIPPVVTCYEASLTPSFYRNTTFTAPSLNVDATAPDPDWGIIVLLLPPVIAIDGEGKVPALVRDAIFASPLIAIDLIHLTPQSFDAVWALVEVPLVTIESGSVQFLPANIAVDSTGLVPEITVMAYSAFILVPKVGIGQTEVY